MSPVPRITLFNRPLMGLHGYRSVNRKCFDTSGARVRSQLIFRTGRARLAFRCDEDEQSYPLLREKFSVTLHGAGDIMNHRSSAHSYRDDPDVPDFNDTRPLTVMDGNCALCTFGARMISRFDRQCEFQICTSQSKLGNALLRHYGFDPDDPESWVFLDNGIAHTSLDGFIAAGRRVGNIGWLLQPLWLIPRELRDRLYAFIARNRIRWFGRTDMCAVPDARLRARLMPDD